MKGLSCYESLFFYETVSIPTLVSDIIKWYAIGNSSQMFISNVTVA